MGTKTNQLSDGWVRKESTSRPNCFYFFNTKSGKTQWEAPVHSDNQKVPPNKSNDAANKILKPGSSSKGRSVQSRLKISSKSKDVKKIKTPAQDRLQRMIDVNKTVAESVSKSVAAKSAISNPNKRTKAMTEHVAKRPNTTAQCTNKSNDSAKPDKQPIDNKVFIKSVASQSVQKFQAATVVGKTPSDEIPTLFPTKNLAQQRLKSIQQKLTVNEENQRNDVLRVFHDSFGMGNQSTVSNVSTVASDDMDEEMDWEPCDDATYSFQQLESMVVEELTDSAYIVPDTNVFLDSLVSIKDAIEKDVNFSVLIPFVVLQELDQLKRRQNDNTVGLKSSRAIKYIYEQLKSKNPRMQGQKATEDKEHIIDVTSPDDKILNCCLQLKSQSKGVVLVTNDINLINKALMSEIEAMPSKKYLEKFDSKHSSVA